MQTYPLLQSQLGVFYDCMKYPQVMQYNIPCITELTNDIDLNRVEEAILAIFAARQELRMRFLIDENGEPRQYVDENKQLTIVRREMTESDFRQYAYHGFCRPYDIMGEEPLLRVELVTVSPLTTHLSITCCWTSVTWCPTERAIWCSSHSATCHWPTRVSLCRHRNTAFWMLPRTKLPA